MEKASILSILREGNTVFTFKDILLSSREKGIYAKDKNYDRLELANRIYTPSYISLETVLSREGIVFQHYEQIFLVSYLTREIICDGQKYVFRKIKDTILTNSLREKR